MLRIADALFSFTVGNFVYTSHNNVLWSGKKAVFPRQALRFYICIHPSSSSPARRHGRRRTSFAALPAAPVAPLPKKFFDTFWEPCKCMTPSPEGGRREGAGRTPPLPCHPERKIFIGDLLERFA